MYLFKYLITIGLRIFGVARILAGLMGGDAIVFVVGLIFGIICFGIASWVAKSNK